MSVVVTVCCCNSQMNKLNVNVTDPSPLLFFYMYRYKVLLKEIISSSHKCLFIYIFSTVPGIVAKKAGVCTDAEGGAGS